MSLSKKKEDLEDWSLDKCDKDKEKTFYWSDDVEEAVRELKEKIHNTLMESSVEWSLNEDLDEVFGENLI